MGLFYPTEAHRNFIEYINRTCKELGVSALLKGSLVKGTATKYSDIDLVLMSKGLDGHFDVIVSGYDSILLSECFSYNSTYMVIYENGLAVEYDVRNTITPRDDSKGVKLGCKSYLFSQQERDRTPCQTVLVPHRDTSYSKK